MKQFLAILILFLAAACSSSAPSKTANCMKISFNSHPTTLDPRRSGDFASSTLICLIYEGLTRCLPDGTSEPGLAYNVEISPDQKQYIFHLRESYWTDGVPVTAYDFEDSWKKIIDPSFPSFCSYLLFPIKNAERCYKGELPLSEAGIQALDPYTLFIELERPTPYFLSLTAFPLFLPYPSHIQENSASIDKPVSNGPFQIDKLIPNAEISLIKNENFWNPEKVLLDQIHISILSDESTALQMFERGDLDWIGGPFAPIPPDAMEMLMKRPELRFVPMAATTFCTFNTETFPFKNSHLRKAFSFAINREEIVEKIAQIGQLPATRSLPPTLFGNQNKVLYPLQDPVLAREFFRRGLDELGIRAEDLSHLTLYYKQGQIEKRLAAALQRQWIEVLGVTVELEQLEQKSQLQILQKRDYQMALGTWIAQFHDPINILERFKDRKNLKNYPGWENQEFASLLNQATLSLDSQKRMEILEQAESLFADQMPLAPIYHWSNPMISNPNICSIPTTPSGGILFERCYFLSQTSL